MDSDSRLHIFWLYRNHEFSTNVEHPGYERGPYLSPETPLRFAIVVLPSPELSHQGGATAAGAEALPAIAQKRALRKIL
jgi:hypothetical protein